MWKQDDRTEIWSLPSPPASPYSILFSLLHSSLPPSHVRHCKTSLYLWLRCQCSPKWTLKMLIRQRTQGSACRTTGRDRADMKAHPLQMSPISRAVCHNKPDSCAALLSCYTPTLHQWTSSPRSESLPNNPLLCSIMSCLGTNELERFWKIPPLWTLN